MRHADVGGLAVAYERAGEGPSLVLLHGILQDSRVWNRQLADLSNQFTVVAWDIPGAGRSADPPEPFAMANWADCLSGLMDAIGMERAHVLGLSWGGILAQEFYRRHPTRARSLILADTYAGWRGSLPASRIGLRAAVGNLLARGIHAHQRVHTEVDAGAFQRSRASRATRGVGVDHVGFPPDRLPADGFVQRGRRYPGSAPEHSRPDPSGLG
jgi:pimeloyl-ACP methyl ester carboxylesterase